MIFLGYDFYSHHDTVGYVATKTHPYIRAEVKNVIIDELYMSNDTNYDMSSIPQEWDSNTVLHALFDGSLSAGNIQYLLNEIEYIIIKRREKNSYEWITLAEIKIDSVEDFNVTYVDRYAEAGKTYEYMLSAVIATAETKLGSAEVESAFDGISIAEKDMAFRAVIYEYTPTERNHLTNVVNTLYSKYPFVIKNSIANYTSGNVHASFTPVDKCELDPDYIEDTLYREKLVDFLTNGRPKLLKLDDGRSWIVNIVDNISMSFDGALMYTDFRFVQTGDSENNEDLYYSDLTMIEE